MKLSDVTLPIQPADARPLAMVFTPALAGRLAELHALHGTTNLVPVPTPLSDGRLALGADLLTEVMPGGLLHAMWAAADQSVLLASVDVVPWADIANLLPPDTPEPTAPASSPTLSPAAAPSGGGTLAPGVAPSLGGAIVR